MSKQSAKCQGVPDSQRWPVKDHLDIFGPRIKEVLVRFHIGARNLTVMPGDQDLCSMEWGMNIVKLRKCTRAEMARNPPWSKDVNYDEQAKGRFWRSFGMSQSKAALVSASEQVAKSVVGFAALASLILLFFETKHSRKCSVYRYICWKCSDPRDFCISP